MDLVAEDETRVGTVYFLMSEDEVRRKVALPWMSFGSDGSAVSAEGAFLKSNLHPRSYGNFARVLGRYVRDEKRATLEDAIHRMTGHPAAVLNLGDRGLPRKPASSPTSSSSIPRRSRTTRPTPSRTSTRRAYRRSS